MFLSRCRILTAALATTTASTSLTISDSTPAGVPNSHSQLADVLTRAKSRLPDLKNPPTATPQYTNATSADHAHARAVLDRYYALSAEAQKANISKEQADAEKGTREENKGHVKKKRAPRVPPEQVFQDFDLESVSGDVCVKYVICGGGTAAWAAIEAILEAEPDAVKDILLVTEEDYYPYNRTVLSKELWEGEKRELYRSEEGTKGAVQYGYKGITGGKISVVRGKRVQGLDTDEKSISFGDGHLVHYHKLLLATGGVPKGAVNVSASLATSSLEDEVTVFRTLDDFRSLRQSLEEKDNGAVVIGGGFLGTELAIALASVSDKITLVMAEAGILYRVLPRYLSEYLAGRLGDIGVKVVRSAIVTDAFRKEGTEDVVSLNLISADADNVDGGKIVVAVGIEPEVDLAKGAGLEIDSENGGIRVNDFMMIEPDIFAAGDVASFHDRNLGRRRVEHWDHAVVSGKIAGRNMVGKTSRYGLQSMFWSDLTNIGVSFTAVGLVDSGLDTVAVWNLEEEADEVVASANKYSTGVVYYMKNGEVVGVLLWNPKRGSGALRRARALVSARTRLGELPEETLGDLVALEEGQYRATIRTKRAV